MPRCRVTSAGLDAMTLQRSARCAPWRATGRVGRSSLTRAARAASIARVKSTAIRATHSLFTLAEPLARHLVPGRRHRSPDSRRTAHTGCRHRRSRLAMALLAYVALDHGRRHAAAVPVRAPDRAARDAHRRAVRRAGERRSVRAARLSVRGRSTGREPCRPRESCLVALLASASIESVQLFEVTRFASLSDVLANGCRRLPRRGAPAAPVPTHCDGRADRRAAVARAAAHGDSSICSFRCSGWTGSPAPNRRRRSGRCWRSDCSERACSLRRNDITSARTICCRAKLMVAAACGWFLLGAFPGLAPRASIVLLLMLAAIGAFVWVRSEDQKRSALDQPPLRVEGALGSGSILRRVSAAARRPGRRTFGIVMAWRAGIRGDAGTGERPRCCTSSRPWRRSPCSATCWPSSAADARRDFGTVCRTWPPGAAVPRWWPRCSRGSARTAARAPALGASRRGRRCTARGSITCSGRTLGDCSGGRNGTPERDGGSTRVQRARDTLA